MYIGPFENNKKQLAGFSSGYARAVSPLALIRRNAPSDELLTALFIRTEIKKKKKKKEPNETQQ